MKIDAFDVSLFSSRHHVETLQTSVTESFSFGDLVDLKSDELQVRDLSGTQFTETETIAEGRYEYQSRTQWLQTVVTQGQPAVSMTDQFKEELEKMRRMMDDILAAFYGRLTGDDSGAPRTTRVNQVFAAAPVSFERTTMQFHAEHEETHFSAQGLVKTADGREIDFTLGMSMERTFIEGSGFIETGEGYAFIDPLVIQADVTAPKLSGAEFSFDLDMDGEAEQIRQPFKGSGFLSLDRNGDGIINDGSELFGPSSGDGFSELAAYDLDGNNWIDENDDIFDELTFWESDGAGGMQLKRIKDAGIGAIYLAAVDTPFGVTDENNRLMAQVKKSSIALDEDGGVRSIHEMDWTA